MNRDKSKTWTNRTKAAAPTRRAGAGAVVRLLFATLLLAQVLDLHSTLSAPAQRREVNPAIVWLGGHVGIPAALFCVKGSSVLIIALLYRSWRRSGGRHNRIYGLVLLNNYA